PVRFLGAGWGRRRRGLRAGAACPGCPASRRGRLSARASREGRPGARGRLELERRLEMNPIMLATDGSPTAEEATKIAIELATALDAPLLVVSCWEVPHEAVAFGYAPMVPDLDRIGEEEAEQAADRAADTAREAGVSAITLIRRGDPEHEICAIATERGARLIVVGSHG